MKLKDAIGMVSGSIYSPCPPGCIVIDIGEEIQEGHLKFFGENFELEVLVDWTPNSKLKSILFNNTYE